MADAPPTHRFYAELARLWPLVSPVGDYAEEAAECARVLHRHCRPGGAVVFVPDALKETFEPGTDCGGTDGADGEGVRYLEWSYDPDPTDDWTVTHYTFVIRSVDGAVSSFTETHRAGLFPRATWLRLLERQGFGAEAMIERTDEDRAPRTLFVGRRPGI